MTKKKDEEMLTNLLSIMFSFDVINTFLDYQWRKYGSNPGRGMILNILRQNDGKATRKQLSEIMHRTPPTVTGLIDTMEKQKLIKRVTNPNDRRSTDIVLTKKGWDKANKLFPVIVDIGTQLVDGMDKNQIEALREALKNIRKQVIVSLKGFESS